MWLPENLKRHAARAGRGAFAALLVAGALAAPPPAAGSLASEAEVQPSGAGAALLDHYRAEPLSDAVLLRPIAEGTAIRSIELTDDGEVLVNGKEFDRDELEGFLGEDGRLVAELADLDPDELRSRLGLAVETEEVEAAPQQEETEAVEVPSRGRHRIRPRHSGDDRVSMGRAIHVGPDETVGDVVCIGCGVSMEGVATGDVVSVGGTIRIAGTVRGQAVSVGGSVYVGEKAEVQDDAVAVGGTVHVADGGRTGGARTSIGVGDALFSGWSDGWGFPYGVFGDLGDLVAAIFRAGVLALLGVLVLLVARGAVDNGVRRITEEPWKAVFAGLLVQLFFLPILVIVTIVLAVSVIGIPLLVLVPVALLAFVIAALFGFVAVGRVVGDWAEKRFGARYSSDILAVVVGIVLIQSVSLVGRIISIPSIGWMGIIGFSIVGLGFFLKYLAWTVGMGSMTLVAFGRDWRRPIARPEPRPESEAPALEAGEPEAAPEAERDEPED